ncbi:flagellar hook-associated protein FlgK [Ponticaulis koreensis]|uniref:flagellar hook-associated protein FlgK n=1 Tax=Ponticaulis koreensis TaxID=1123045 RepID=UPI0003B3D08E|nr:flagellar hook-associated protein FlgK [Ponticaulis koreensis]
MSVNSIMNTGLSALLANQSALRVTSNNIANVNTEGYVRQDARTAQTVLNGQGTGVELIVQRAADRFLAAAHLSGISNAGQYQATAGLLDRAQAGFGDPTSSTSMFAAVDNLMSDAAALASDASSSLRKTDFVSSVNATFQDIQATFETIDGLRDEAHQKLTVAVSDTNQILSQISVLNAEIQKFRMAGADASGAETQQSQLMDQLAGYIDFKVTQRELGGVELRTTSGLLLVDHRAAELAVNQSTDGARYPGVSISPAGSDAELDVTRQIQSGEIRGLLTARDSDLPDLAYSLGEYASALADQLNQAHNEGTAVPAPTSLTGRETGLLGTDALNFTGAATFAVVDSSGRTIESVQVDFDAGTLTTSAGGVTAMGGTITGFTSALNSAFGGSATVSFTDGVMSLSATGTNGVAIAQDPTNPSDRGGRGVSAFFGLNDVVTTSRPVFYQTGLSGTDTHGITSGDITFGIRNGNGDLIQSITYTPGGTTFDDIINDLNGAGVLGSFATASLDANGSLTISPNTAGSVAVIDVISDTTLRGTTGTSLSAIFGLGIEGPAERARGLSLKDELSLSPSLLATSKFDTTATAVGSVGVAAGSNDGALALQGALGSAVNLRTMQGAEYLNLSLTDAAAQIASDAGSKATTLLNRAEASEALREEAKLRRASAEGVNLDEEMVNMTVFQQSYSAASRLIQASKDMYDTLLNMV